MLGNVGWPDGYTPGPEDTDYCDLIDGPCSCDSTDDGRNLTTIRVNRYRIAYNAGVRLKEDGLKPVILVEYPDGRMIHAFEVMIAGPSTVKYQPDNPPGCGASCWMETPANVTPIGDHESTCPAKLKEECK